MQIFCMPTRQENGSLAVRKLLRHAVLLTYGISAPEIEKTENGKPWFPTLPQLHFSLSHTQEYVLCALSDVPVGCDIENNRRKVSPRLSARVCHPEELAAFPFFSLWTLKESLIKLTDSRLRDLKTMVFEHRGNDIFSPSFDVYGMLYHTVPGHTVAVCSKIPDFPPEIHIVSPEKLTENT